MVKVKQQMLAVSKGLSIQTGCKNNCTFTPFMALECTSNMVKVKQQMLAVSKGLQSIHVS